MARLLAGLITTLSLVLVPVGALWAAIPVTWVETQDEAVALFQTALSQSGMVQDAASLADAPLDWPDELRILAGGEGIPRYEPDTQTIHLPASYLAEAVRAQSHFEVSRVDALRRGLDMVEYTLYHLLGHAVVGVYDEANDERAEHISTWLMVSSFSNGGEQWLENVRAFGRASQKLDGPTSEYWHRHALYRSRERQLNCLIFGSDIDHFANLFPGLAESPEKALACVEAWQTLDDRLR